ncbi:MAG: enoyl-CoA hydratase/isomerase family protein [Chloroflexi bacterium]|nr:enoyl-CoA hydratase/isomerase family protein [Chloroflexota bacterium]MYF21298.1 enoyl-CoA hydratase/isomerase family protein [Chloroflexota bacterium]
MTEYENVLVEIDGPVATITLNRPEKLNAISGGLRDDLEGALRELNPGDEVRVIRLKGAGRAFCAGYDLTPGGGAMTWRPNQRRGDQAWELGESRIALDRENLRVSVDRWMWMWGYRKPIVAQVHGWCLAGGGEMIGACDIVFAAESARFGHPTGRAIGIPPTLGLWPAKIGMLKTKELLFSGDTVDGIEAERIGMINRAYPEDQLDEETMAWCQRIANVPLDGLTVHKHSTNRWFELMGLRTAASEGADFDAIWHEAPSIDEFTRIGREKGLKVALEWRDDPFGDGRGAIRRRT